MGGGGGQIVCTQLTRGRPTSGGGGGTWIFDTLSLIGNHILQDKLSTLQIGHNLAAWTAALLVGDKLEGGSSHIITELAAQKRWSVPFRSSTTQHNET